MQKVSPINMHFDLSTFKIQPCKNDSGHDIKKCIFYHFNSDKRRSLAKFQYKKIICPDKQKCTSNICPFSHNYMEQIYHPDNYKKKYCKDFIETKNCKFGIYCALVHSDFELKIRPLHLMYIDRDFLLFHFKSEFCPFSKIEHDRFKCVYAHNWQDFKRPFNLSLKPILCQNWNKDKEIIIYEQGCTAGHDCRYCHGWKENEYHYLNFKKIDCKKGGLCNRKDVCSFRHSESECNDTLDTDDEFFVPIVKNQSLSQESPVAYLHLIEVKLKAIKNKPKKSEKHYEQVSQLNRQLRLAKNTKRDVNLIDTQRRLRDSRCQLSYNGNLKAIEPLNITETTKRAFYFDDTAFIENDSKFKSAMLPNEKIDSTEVNGYNRESKHKICQENHVDAENLIDGE